MMKKELLVFGANGVLGIGVTNVLSKKDFDKIYLFDFDIKNKASNNKKITTIEIKDLSKEENVSEPFNIIAPSKDTLFFLYSTVGGFAGGKPVWETDINEWDKMMNINLKSSFLIAKYFSKLVKDSAGGSICFTAAFTGVNPEEKKSSYGAAKSGLIHLVKTLSIEGKKINLSANAIAPFIIDTPANRDWMKNADYNKWIKPEEIGELSYALFNNFNFISGNIISLTERFNISFGKIL